MERFEYMKVPLKKFPDHICHQYNLTENAKKGFTYLEIQKVIYGLPASGRIANLQLQEKLKPSGYSKVQHTPVLWKHTTRPVQFTLVVDDCGVKCVEKEHVQHLINILKNA